MNLIPFAYIAATKELVDVADVPSGKGCRCVCPSCNIPLIAKKGKVNEWHFAHDNQFVDKYKINPCGFSRVVAVKMMLKQLLMEGTKILLPDYDMVLPNLDYKNTTPRQVLITTSSIAKYHNPMLKEYGCDIVLDVNGKKLGLMFTLNKKYTIGESKVDPHLIGLIGIDINSFTYDERGKAVNNLREYLKSSLEVHVRGKFWVYHARQKRVIEKHLQQLSVPQRASQNKKIYRNTEQEINTTKFTTVKKVQRSWFCVACNYTYQGENIGLNPCPKCNSHFNRRAL
jgi:predicted Zn-ribbon and HTH transcriptional regulator